MPVSKGKTLNVKRVIAKITNFEIPEEQHIKKIKKFIQNNNMDCNNDELKRLLKQYTGSISKIQNITQTELFQTFDQWFHTTFWWNLQSLRDTSINENMSINKSSYSCTYRQYYQFALYKVFDWELSLSDIGISISWSDHSTVLHAIKVCRNRQFTKDKEVQKLFQLLHSMPKYTKHNVVSLDDIIEREYDNNHETIDILADIMHTKEFQNQMLEIVENKPSKNKYLIKKMLESLTKTYHTIQSQKKSLSQSQ